MHLHDALRLWRAEVVSDAPRVALTADDLRDIDPATLDGLSRETLPSGLRRDDRSAVQAVLAAAEHRPGRPATGDDLDALEQRLGVPLPRGLELLLSLHDGGDFFAATVPGLEGGPGAPLRLLSCSEIGDAYERMLRAITAALEEADPDGDDLFRLARRFGASRDQANVLGDQLGAVHGGATRGLEIYPIARLSGREDLLTLVALAGREGRVGHTYAVSGYLPEHSDEFPFDGLQGWLEALVRARGCRRVVA